VIKYNFPWAFTTRPPYVDGGRVVNTQEKLYFITQVHNYVWYLLYKTFESPPKYFDLGLENRVAYNGLSK
jgi:hypothetical protein